MKQKKSVLSSFSTRQKLTLMSALIILPFLVLTGIVIYELNRLAASYDLIVKNITNANEYNIVFKEKMDSVMYQMVARSLEKTEVEEELSMTNPDELIDSAASDFTRIVDLTTSVEAKSRIKSILKLLGTLKKRTNEINNTVKMSGQYDDNMLRLDTDIRIITELIQERISEYIYYESSTMETMRQDIDRQKTILINLTLLIVLVLLGTSVLFTVTISRSITAPIDELCLATDEVAHGNFAVRTNIESSSELIQLGNSLNSMAAQLGGLVENIKREQINSRNLELRLLQAQINPHFLYNTLDNIVWLSEDDRKEEVASIVTSLSRFFRTTLSGGRDFIRIRDELSHVEAYLEIQQFRYRDILDYRIDVPKTYLEYAIIKMTLQPIVENALYHGLKNKRGKGEIRIGISERLLRYTKDQDIFKGVGFEAAGENALVTIDPDTVEQLVLFVEDDGIGMKPEELSRIQRIADGKEKPSIDNKGFGISNVAERLKLNYGEYGGLKISSVFGEGTRVEIMIPKTFMEADS
ncbi:MAG: histidine kinase [Lachnospiraceae bacterium]|nr:histidine kinase [Lachnospiraceae bacterium]